MKRGDWLAVVATAILLLVLAGPASAAERTVNLNVRMFCPVCDYNVTRILNSVSGVKNVKVSLQRQMAVVTFDDSVTEIATLVRLTQRYGYETRLLSREEASARLRATPRTNGRREDVKKGGLLDFFRRLWPGRGEPVVRAQ